MARAALRWLGLWIVGVALVTLVGCDEYVPAALQADPAPPAPDVSGGRTDKGAAAGQPLARNNARFDSVLDDVLSRGELRVGVSPGFVPFVAAGKDAGMVREKAAGPLAEDPRDVVGFDIEIARALADSLQVKLTVVQKDGVASILRALQDGDVDMAISGLSRTLTRARDFFFSSPYFTSGMVLLVPQTSRYQKLADLNDQRVRLLVKPNTTSQSFASRRLPNAQVIAAKDERTLATLFDQGDKVAVVDQIKARNFQLNKMMDVPFRILEGRRFTDERFSIALPRDEAWRSYIDIFLEDFRESGHLAEVEAKFALWFSQGR